MSLLGGIISISNLSTLLFVVFAVLLGGYLLGRITVKGISLGDAGVFIIALLLGAFAFHIDPETNELLFALEDTLQSRNQLQNIGVFFAQGFNFQAGQALQAKIQNSLRLNIG